ncbi:MAG: hypothetical protein RB289_09960 [Paludibacter sp.]|nr:hypothetical protein [Paludibacter sp.]
MPNELLICLMSGSNNPPEDYIEFNSSDHIRFQNGTDISGHNYGCNRQIKIEKNISGNNGYTVTIINLDSNHPVWGNNIQMAPKQMKIIKIENDIVTLRGYGTDSLNASFADYGIDILIQNNEIERVQLNMFDRNISLLYLK